MSNYFDLYAQLSGQQHRGEPTTGALPGVRTYPDWRIKCTEARKLRTLAESKYEAHLARKRRANLVVMSVSALVFVACVLAALVGAVLP